MKLQSNILKAALFATGLSGIVAEYVLSTLATYFLGDSVFQFTMIVSIMLFSMGLGSRLSKRLGTNLLKSFVIIEFALSVLTSFSSLITYTAAAYYTFVGFIIYGMSIIIGLLIGMEIPLAIRLNDQFEELKVNVSSILEKDYYGSLVGGMFFAFIGLPYIGLAHTPFILGGLNFLVAISLIVVLWNVVSPEVKKPFIVMAAGVGILLIVGSLSVKPIISYGESLRYKDQVIFEEQSKYQKIVITKSNSDFWLFINGNQQMSTVDEAMYHEPLVHPAMKYSLVPQNILVLGGGDGAAVREILKYESVDSITLVDLDPMMTELGISHPLLTEMNQNSLLDRKVKILNQDAFTFMENEAAYYDVIIIDLPDPKTVELGRMYSYEFYLLCYKHLRPNGVTITQAGSPYYASRAFKCIDLSMQEAGFTTAPLHNQVVTLGEWGWVLGVKNREKEELKNIMQQLSFEDIPTRWLNAEAMILMTSFGRDVFDPNPTDSVEVNRVHNPVLYKYYLKGNWDLY